MDYGRTPAMVLAKGWRAAACVVPVAFVIAALWHFRDRVRPLAIGGIIILAGVLPVLGLLPFEFQTRSTVADHYVYVSMLGLALAAAWGFARLPHRLGFYATVLILGALAMRTLNQTRYWKNSRTLFAHAIEVNPLSFSANQNLAVIAGYDAELLSSQASMLADHDANAADECRAAANEKLRDSERYLAKVLELQPGFPSALHTRAALRARFGRHHEAIEDLNALLDSLPSLREDEQQTFAGDFNMLGQEYLRVQEPEKAMKCFDRMLQLRPNDKSAQRGKAKAVAMAREMAEID
jgi:tetratricopeptide (TPR) repeat protein